MTTDIEFELEKDILGMMLLDNTLIAPISEMLNANDFKTDIHKTIFNTIVEMYINNRGNGIDIILLVNELNKKLALEIKDVKKLVKEYMECVATVKTYKSVAEKIKQHSVKRQARTICNETSLNIDAENSNETVLHTSEKLNMLLNNETEQEMVSVSDMVMQYHSSLFDDNKNKDFFQTGYKMLDEILLPTKSNVTIIAGRPATGKTAFALNIMLSLMRQNKTVCFFSLEMSKEKELMDRLYSAKGNILYDKLQRGEVKDKSVEIAKLSEYFCSRAKQFYICDKGCLTTQEIKLKAMTKKADVIVIDYLQLITPTKVTNNRANDVSEISRNLKIIAKELNAWVICLAQLNRDVEKRANPRPVLSDLRESGAIEQDANQIILMSAQNEEDTDSKDKTTIVIDVAKNRNGRQQACLMTFDKPIQRFISIDTRYEEQKPYVKKDDEIIPNEYD